MSEFMNRLEEIAKEIEVFRTEREWKQFHNEKDLAISISLEAAELLELFQWKTSIEVTNNNLKSLKEELADIFIYGFMLANNLDVDISEIIREKLEMNRKKYPIEKSKGSKKKYTELEK